MCDTKCTNRNAGGFNCHACDGCKSRAQVDPLRRTGRTSRTIERAICGMLMGKHVLLVMANQEHVKLAMAHAKEWLYRNGFADNGKIPVTVENTNGLIRFGTSSLRILPLEANVHGLRFELTLQDHCADELLAEKARKAARIAAGHEICRLMREHGFTHAIQLNRVMTREGSLDFN